MRNSKKKKHLISAWNLIKKKIKDKYVYLFLDFDGTLCRLRRKPSAAKLSVSNFKILKKLAGCKNITLAVVSGRELREIKKLVGIKKIIYAGNHGMEIYGAAARSGRFVKKENNKIKEIRKELRKNLKGIKGVFVEDKGFTVSAHFRMAAGSEEKEIIRIIKKVTLPYEKAGYIRVIKGKKVLEIRPSSAMDKGGCAEYLLKKEEKTRKTGVIPFYLGDDQTDEDAFNRLKGKGFCVEVVSKKNQETAADYYLKGVQEVRRFLKRLYGLVV